ncbi:MAG: SAM-dependent methyltransferase [Bacteroidales bacterium]|nr:MAG: SAM-dependent methyltransferase [Bacteroidales bacterium]
MLKHIISLASRFIPRHYQQMVVAFLLRSIAIFYIGNRIEDPISGKKYRKILPYGRLQSRPNALAFHSLSLERHRLIWLYLKNRTDFFTSPKRVLHIAPEYCFIKPFKKLANLDYITADLISPWADVKLDVQSIPFPDSNFDIIICNHVLEHVDDDRQAMSEMFRIMKPGGFGIFQIPLDYSLEVTLEDSNINTPELREKHYKQRDHLRLYGRDYAKRLREAGFDVTEDNYVHTFSEDLIKRYALPKDEILYICRKV